MQDAAQAELEAGLEAAIRNFRVAAFAWLALVTALSYGSVDRPIAAVAGVAASAAVTAAWWRMPGSRPLVVVELVVGAGLVAADGWVYDGGQAQSFGTVWPLAGILATAVLLSPGAAIAAGVVLGAARLAGEIAFVEGPWSATRVLGIAATGVLFALAGWAAGWAARRIRTSELRAARAAARDEVAAELHDGVLQTLAVIQRRSDDEDLVHLARTQEAELRRYLVDPEEPADGVTNLDQLFRDVTADATRRFSLRVEQATVPPLPSVPDPLAAALRGALGECLANVAKHSGVDRAVLFAEHDADLLVSVTDRGAGFDPTAATFRGLDRSVRTRIARAGGTIELTAAPGAGTTVTIRIPLEAM